MSHNLKDEIVILVDKQIELQKQATIELSNSNLDSTKLLSNQIEKNIVSFENNLMQISDEVESWGNEVSDILLYIHEDTTEIRWKLRQIDDKMDDLLRVLVESRNNEAKQLVRQGVRHYVNGQYGKAEERFMLALKYDTTDYQVLMNLGYIEERKGNLSEALSYFKDALNLPLHKSAISKAFAFWAISKIYYDNKEYEQAILNSEKAISQLEEKNSDWVYLSSVYTAMTGDLQGTIDKLKEAILLDPHNYSKAAVDPNLKIIHQDVLDLLNNIYLKEYSYANEMIQILENETSKINTKEMKGFLVIEKFVGEIEKIKASLNYSQYTKCRTCTYKLNKLLLINKSLQNLMSLKTSLKSLKTKKSDYKPLLSGDSMSGLVAIYIIVAYLYTGVMVIFELENWPWDTYGERFFQIITGLIGGLFWPLLVLINSMSSWIWNLIIIEILVGFLLGRISHHKNNQEKRISEASKDYEKTLAIVKLEEKSILNELAKLEVK